MNRRITAFRPSSGYWVAISSALAAAFLDYTLSFLVEFPDHGSLLFFALAITLSGWHGGITCGVFCAVLSAFLALWVAPLGPADLALFLPPALGLGVAAGWARRAAIARARASVAEMAGQLRAVLDGATEVSIIATDVDGLITVFNSGAEQMLGYRAEEMIGKQTPAVIHDPVEVAAHGAALEQELGAPVTGFDVFVAHARQGGHEEREWTYIRKDGSRLTVNLVVTAVRNAAGAITGFLGVAKDVTRARRAEARLRESEERFRQLVEGVRDYAFFTLDTEGVVTSWNAGAARLTGYTEQDVLGAHISSFYSTTDAGDGRSDRMLESARSAGRHEETGWQVRKGGERFWAEIALSPICLEDETPWAFAVLTRDASERRAADEALATNEALLRQFIQHSPAAIAMFDTEMRYLQASNRWLSDYHLEEQVIIGRSHYEVFPDIPERWKEVHRRVLAGAVEECAEDPFERDDGGTEWLQWECQPWYRVGGVVGGIIMFTQVITERKETEERLREQEDRFRGAFSNAPIGMALVSPEGAWLRVNRSVCDILGFTEEELLSTTFKTITHPEDLDPDLENVRRTLAGEIPSYQMEKRYFHKDGHVVHAILSVSLVRDARGEPLYFISQILDITERKQFEDQIRSSLKEKELLLQEVHHRVKNNLQVISTLLDLQTDYTLDDGAKNLLQESQERVRSMALIHERLYHTADFTQVDFSDYVERLAEGLYRAYRTSADEVCLEVSVDGRPLPIDTAIPCGLLLNELISNCLKHAFPGGGRGVIRVTLNQDGGAGMLRVADDGCGMPADRDFRQSSSFGLQLVHTLVAQLRGELEIDTSCGTAITVRFPTSE